MPKREIFPDKNMSFVSILENEAICLVLVLGHIAIVTGLDIPVSRNG